MTSRSSSKSTKGRSGNKSNISKEAQRKGGENSHGGRGRK